MHRHVDRRHGGSAPEVNEYQSKKIWNGQAFELNGNDYQTRKHNNRIPRMQSGDMSTHNSSSLDGYLISNRHNTCVANGFQSSCDLNSSVKERNICYWNNPDKLVNRLRELTASNIGLEAIQICQQLQKKNRVY